MKTKFSILLFVLAITNVNAQDFHLSQYDAVPMYLNPAQTGLIDGPLRIYGNYRSQWGSIIPNAFVTTTVAGDMPIKQFGAGLQIMNNRAGSGSYNVFSLLLSGAYDLALDDKGNHLRGGLQLGFVQKSIDFSSLIFNNQYVSSGNGGFNSALSSGENFSNQSVTAPAVNMGYSYHHSNPSSFFNPFLGFSVYNILRPSESFLSASAKLPFRFQVHGGSKINFTEKFQMAPRALFMRQGNVNEVIAGLMLHYYFVGANTYFLLGSDYRFGDAAVLHLGMKRFGYFYRLSYDINTSTLNEFSTGKGAIEFSVTFVPEKKKRIRVRGCTRL